VASTSRTTRRPLVIAAACVVVIGLLAAVLALATRGDSPTPTAASSPSATASPDLPDTAVAYRAAKDGGGIALVGTYQQSGFEELGGTSQLFDHWGRFTQNPTAVKVALNLHKLQGQTVYAAYVCNPACSPNTQIQTDSSRGCLEGSSTDDACVTVVLPLDKLVIVLIRNGWRKEPGSPNLVSQAGLHAMVTDALGRERAGLDDWFTGA